MWSRIVFAMLLAGLVSGCGALDPIANVGVGAGVGTLYSLGTTEKLPTDHLLSAATGRDCSIVTFEKTGYYCPPNIAVDRSNLYCFKTLAGIDCHTRPDPYRNGNRPLASPPPNRVLVQ